MMDTPITYQGFRIQSMPYAMPGQWRTRICISLENDRGIKTREFSAESIYETEKEATIHGIAFGQRIIDGKIAGHSDRRHEDGRSPGHATPSSTIPHHVFGIPDLGRGGRYA